MTDEATARVEKVMAKVRPYRFSGIGLNRIWTSIRSGAIPASRHYWNLFEIYFVRGDRFISGTIEIDEDVREEYWNEIGSLLDHKHQKPIRIVGKRF